MPLAPAMHPGHTARRRPVASTTAAPDTENWSHRQSRLRGSHATGPRDPETPTVHSSEAGFGQAACP